jgi:hypothetical protein
MTLDDSDFQVRFLIHDRDAKFPHPPCLRPSLQPPETPPRPQPEAA